MGDDWSIKELLSELKNILKNIIYGSANTDVKLGFFVFLYFPIGAIISIIATVQNFIGWSKNKRKNCLYAGILYVITLNIPSAFLSFVGRSDIANPIKKKSLLFSIPIGVLAALVWVLFVVTSINDKENLGTWIFFMVITLVGVIVNILAKLIEKKALTLVAAILYTVGIASVASAVICYINFARFEKGSLLNE